MSLTETLRQRFIKKTGVQIDSKAFTEAFKFGQAQQANAALGIHIALDYCKKYFEERYPTTYKDFDPWKVCHAAITTYEKTFPDFSTRRAEKERP